MKWLILMFLLLPALGQAEDVCPWINAATIGGVLGGPVTVTVTQAAQNKSDATCDFTRQGILPAYTLHIEVVTMADVRSEYGPYVAACGVNPAHIRGIGNEAVACSLPEKDGRETEAVISRVRERAFTVRVSSKMVKPAALRDQALDVAEQVAGFLF